MVSVRGLRRYLSFSSFLPDPIDCGVRKRIFHDPSEAGITSSNEVFSAANLADQNNVVQDEAHDDFLRLFLPNQYRFKTKI
jgi:hypothetical protein